MAERGPNDSMAIMQPDAMISQGKVGLLARMELADGVTAVTPVRRKICLVGKIISLFHQRKCI